MDDSWDVPLNNDTSFCGSLILNTEKFPSFCRGGNGLKKLSDKIKSLGWKGLGGWICAQESPLYSAGKTAEEYWIERLKEADRADILYWKVDWGDKGCSDAFRKMLTEQARLYAPRLIVEHAAIKSVAQYSDVFRTYDVPAIMSIPMTISKIAELKDFFLPIGQSKCIINCEDEAYIAAAGGFAMGIMRHPLIGAFPDGREDKSFPSVHRNIKTKTLEVLRATRWHRISPAFGGGRLKISDTTLSDEWEFFDKASEIEAWWFENRAIADFIKDGKLQKTAPSALSRNAELPTVLPDENGNTPFCVVSFAPNGTYAVATLGRTLGRKYFIPECDITVKAQNADTFGVFGRYRSLTVETEADFKRVLIQDLADNYAYDISDKTEKTARGFKIPGSLITVASAPSTSCDTSEPGVVIKLMK